MNEMVVVIALALFGACLGSFAAASVWRLRARELRAERDAGEKYDKKEYSRLKRLLGRSVSEDRSLCLECGYQLRWYDLVPVLSWLFLRGRCRSCRKFIGWHEILMELGVATFFVASYLLWPGGVETVLDAIHLGLWLIAGVAMSILFSYDVKWYLLPNSATIALALLGAGVVAVSAVESGDVVSTLLSALGAVFSISGLYAALYFVSKGRWVGFGDVKLGVGLGLLVVDWQLGLLTVFLANAIGCLIVIPLLLTKKISRTSHVPFGPMLIAGAIIAVFFGWDILDWYASLLGV